MEEGIPMFNRYFAKKKLSAFFALIALALLFTACGGGNSTSATVSSSLSGSSTPTSTPTGGTSATATLQHQPVGTATLTWDQTTHMLTIQSKVTGLAPNSVHPVHINQGSCSDINATNSARTLYTLNMTADAYGIASATSKFVVAEGIPAKNWYFTIYNGPGLSTASQAEAIACGDVINSNTSLRSSQTVQVSLESTQSANQDVSGTATLSLSGHTLTVKLTLSGMQPYSQHMVHIHAGSCVHQGAVVYSLTPVKADAEGKSTTTTIIQNVTTIPPSGWYINLHNGTDLSTQTGFDPIACGDVMLNKA